MYPHPLLLLSVLTSLFSACSSSRPATSAPVMGGSPRTTVAAPPATTPVPTPTAPVATVQTSHLDSASTPPRPTVLIPGQNAFAVRTKLIPRVMGRGWVLMVNKPDSMEFFRPADSLLTSYLFGIPGAPNQKLRLRFILTPEGDGTRIALMGHLIGKDGLLPNVAQEAPLMENLTSLQADLLAAPPMQSHDKASKKKKK